MVNFHPGIGHYCYLCLNLYCCITVSEGIMLVVVVSVPNLLVAIGNATGVTVSKLTNHTPCHRVELLPDMVVHISAHDDAV